MSLRRTAEAHPTPGRRLVAALAAVLLVAALVTVPAGGARAVGETSFTNPLLPNGADPWLEYWNGNYYLATTTWTSQLEPLPDGSVRFVARHSGKVLDLANCGLANGTSLNQWPWLNNICQRFHLRPV